MSGREKGNILAYYVKEYMDKHNLPYDEVYYGQGKPVASYYVDDRGIRCLPQTDPKAYDKVLEVVMNDNYIPMSDGE